MSRTLFRHPHIVTGAPEAPRTSALLVEDGVIVAVGDDAVAAAGRVTVVDLPGEAVLPGLHDAHIHTEWLARDLAGVDLRAARSLDDALRRLGEHARGLPPGQRIDSGRWDSNRWRPPAVPDRHSLDRVVADRVVTLPSVDGHTAWVNTAALRAAGITRDTPDPVGGEVVRDAHGEPTGILRENAIALLDALPEASSPLRPLLERAQDLLLSVGLTSITDLDGEDARAAYAAMHADGRLRIRVHKGIQAADLDRAVAQGRRAGQGDALLSVGPVKFFSDGALGSHTAHMSEPLAGHASCGVAVTPYPVLLERIRYAVDAGLDVCTHAIGDEANRLVLDAYEVVRAAGSEALLRVEHAQHVRPTDIARFARLGVIASMQPSHATADCELAEALLGDRPVASYAWRAMLDAGVAVAFGSDAPVEDPNPFLGLHAAVTRQRADGFPPGGWQPAERISLDEAVAAYTVGAAEAVGRLDVGRLAVGQRADLIAVDRDPWRVDPPALRDTQVLQTVVGGEPALPR